MIVGLRDLSSMDVNDRSLNTFHRQLRAMMFQGEVFFSAGLLWTNIIVASVGEVTQKSK